MLFVLKATGWTDNEEMQNKIEEVLEKWNERFWQKNATSTFGGTTMWLSQALLNDPELILADEPTGNLDPQTSAEVLEVLKKINANGKPLLWRHMIMLCNEIPSKH
jgi:cell division transport system ATP-binding protein